MSQHDPTPHWTHRRYVKIQCDLKAEHHACNVLSSAPETIMTLDQCGKDQASVLHEWGHVFGMWMSLYTQTHRQSSTCALFQR